MPQKESKPKKKSMAALYIVAILAVIAVLGITGYFLTRDDKGSLVDTRDFSSYPTVNTSVSSSKDGKSHTLDVDLVVEYEDGTEVSHDAIYEIMQQTVSSLDYEALKGEDSVEHIEAAVKENIEKSIGGGVSNVYVGNIAIDFPGSLDSSQDTKKDSQTQQKLKGLFKNLAD